MNYIPHIRVKKTASLRENADNNPDREVEDNQYWQGYLNDQDTEILKGFDQCAEQAVNGFFSSLAIYKKELMKAFDIDANSDEDPTSVNLDIMFSRRSISGGGYSKEELETMDKYTKAFKVIKECMINHIDIERDLIGTSMIDSMDKNEYEKIKEDVNSGKRHTYYTDIKLD